VCKLQRHHSIPSDSEEMIYEMKPSAGESTQLAGKYQLEKYRIISW